MIGLKLQANIPLLIFDIIINVSWFLKIFFWKI